MTNSCTVVVIVRTWGSVPQAPNPTLMVEGGGDLLTQFLAEGLADELQLAIAPVFVRDRRGRRFARDSGR